jgi:Tol biopolymer transport system component
MRPLRALAKGISLFVICTTSSSAQVTQIVSVASSGAQANGDSYYSSISADGRYVAFSSNATNLVPSDTNTASEVFVRERQLGLTERVSIDSAGAQANGASYYSSISADGRYVAFQSDATNLVPSDTNAASDIFVRDRQLGLTERVSIDSAGAQANGNSYYPSISADGRYVAFQSYATNLVPGDTNEASDVFVRDRLNGTTERASVAIDGTQGNYLSGHPSISADGRYVAFTSLASNLVPGDTNNVFDVIVHDRMTGTTERVSVDSAGTQGNNDSGFYGLAISADGRYVAFQSVATNLVAGDTNVASDIFVRDRQLGLTERVSINSASVQGNSDSEYTAISGDGRYVAFQSFATNLVVGDTNASSDIFVRDRQLALTERVSIDSGGAQGNSDSEYPSISSDGRFVAFQSLATNLVALDTNAASDVFARDRSASSFTSLCDPAVAGVIACPCSNSPSGLGHGCDNSSSTGGAALAASGIAYLSMDTLFFTTSGEKPTATSVVLQGTALAASGLVFGQGVRCIGGTLKRLYTKTAIGGSITAPDAFDVPVSQQSAALGDRISPGQSRWYLVYYRDPIVLGGCAASSTFNATQTGRIDWSP